MNKIFIEAKKKETAECCFLQTVLSQNCPNKEVEFVCMDGVRNLFNDSNIIKMRIAMDEGDNVLVILDADNPQKDAGFAARSQFVEAQRQALNLSFEYFLYPNNADDGDVETLMESLARKDLHCKWWDCFGDYEKCVGNLKDANGNKRYNVPNLKAKLHTFISSQLLSNKQRNTIGKGNWLFDDTSYWNLSRAELQPLIDFFRTNLQ